MKNFNNTGVTLLEILLSAVIFVIAVGGIFATLNAVRTPVANKKGALTAAVFARQALETLRSQVDAQTFYNDCSGNPCPDFSLSMGQHQVNTATLLSYGLSWPQALAAVNPNGLSYRVSCADGTTTTCSSAGSNPDMARRIDLTINWPDVT